MKHKFLEDYKGTKALYPYRGNIYTVRDKNDDLYENGKKIDSGVELYNITYLKESIVYVKDEKTYLGNITIDKNIVPNSISENLAVFTSNFDLNSETLTYEVIDIITGQVIYDFGPLTYMSKIIVFKETDIGTRNPILDSAKFYLVDWENRVHEFELE